MFAGATGKGVLVILLAVQSSAVLASSLDTQTLANVVFNGVTQASDVDSTAPGGSVSAVASGPGFVGSAQGFVDASNFGHLRLSGLASMSLSSGSGQSTSQSSIAIQDEWIFTNANFIGQAGIASVSILISGAWSAPGDWGQVNTGVEFDILGAGSIDPRLNYAGLLTARVNQPSLESCRNGGLPTQCFGLFTFDIPFVFGDELDIRYLVSASARIAPGNVGGVPRSGTVSYDLANSILWGGISGVTVGGQRVDYGFSSNSTFDWRQSSIPPNGVPEPATLALIVLGVFGIALMRRRPR